MMIDETIFDDIRPYRDEEIPAAMHRIADNDLFPLLSSFAFPDRNVEDVRAEVRSISTVYDFQKQMMWYVNEQIVKRSMSSYTVSGIENLDPSGHYLLCPTTGTSCWTPPYSRMFCMRTDSGPQRSHSAPT